MKKKLIDILSESFKEVKFNKDLAKKFYQYQVGFVNKNEDHMLFFGGNLTGVQVVRFTPTDYSNYFDSLLQIDSGMLIEMLESESSINMDFQVSSDEFNLASFYCMYRFLTTPYLNDKERLDAAVDACLIYHYRILTARLAHTFRYPVDPDIAQATYAGLSSRFLIKKLGSWSAVLEYRVNEIIREDGLHTHILRTFNDDIAIVNMINDTQGRVRDMVKNIAREFYKTHISGERIDTNSNTELTLDGKEIIKDKVHGPDIYYKYILSVMSDEYTFIKEELFGIVVQALPGISTRLLRSMLQWLTLQVHGKYRADSEEFIRNILLYTIEYLSKNGNIIKQTRDIMSLTVDIRNLYLASRSADEELKIIRDSGARLITSFSPDSSDSTISAVRTGMILYITLRAFTKHHYHG